MRLWPAVLRRGGLIVLNRMLRNAHVQRNHDVIQCNGASSYFTGHHLPMASAHLSISFANASANC